MVRSLLILLACASCVRGAGSYRCANDNECLIDGVAGQCEAIGYCSFPDGLCETGYRFGSYSGMYANACVTPGNTGYVTVGGNVSGLVGTNLVLRNNGADDLLVTASGAFSFETALMNGVPYEVTVAAQPSNPQQTCSLAMGAGVTAMDNITDVEVACATTTYMIGGTVVGLIGTGMVLTLNGGNDRTITGNGSFAFVSQIASGEMYTVAIKTQPTGRPAMSPARRERSAPPTYRASSSTARPGRSPLVAPSPASRARPCCATTARTPSRSPPTARSRSRPRFRRRRATR